MESTAINKARIVYYGLFSSLFSFNMKEDKYKKIVQYVDILSTSPIDEQTEKALINIKRRIKKGGYIAVKMESDRIFFNPTTTFIPMTASYYIEHRDNGNKRIEMINYVFESKFRRDTDQFKEHEDHIEFILLFIQKLIHEELEGDTSAPILARKVFSHILNEMIDDFSLNLFNHEKSFFYKQIALALRSFIDFERLYFNVQKPVKTEPNNLAKPNIKKDKQQPRECIKLGHGEW